MLIYGSGQLVEWSRKNQRKKETSKKCARENAGRKEKRLINCHSGVEKCAGAPNRFSLSFSLSSRSSRSFVRSFVRPSSILFPLFQSDCRTNSRFRCSNSSTTHTCASAYARPYAQHNNKYIRRIDRCTMMSEIERACEFLTLIIFYRVFARGIQKERNMYVWWHVSGLFKQNFTTLLSPLFQAIINCFRVCFPRGFAPRLI